MTLLADVGEREYLMRAKRSITDLRHFVQRTARERIALDTAPRAAFERLFERLSDASRPIAARWKREYPSVSWSTIGEIGDEIHYAYDRVDLQNLFRVYANDLDPLEAAVDAMLAAHDK